MKWYESCRLNARLWWGIVGLVLSTSWVIHTIVKGSHGRSFLMHAVSCMGILMFPGTRNMTDSYCSIQGVRLIGEDSQGAVLGCCMWMMKRGKYGVKLFGCRGLQRLCWLSNLLFVSVTPLYSIL